MYRVGQQYRTLLIVRNNLRNPIQPFLDQYTDSSEPSGVRVDRVNMRVRVSNGWSWGYRCEIQQEVMQRTGGKGRSCFAEGCDEKMPRMEAYAESTTNQQ